MRYCVNSKVKSLLKDADEIMVTWRDRSDILDLAHDYKKDIVLDVPFESTPTDTELKTLKREANDRLMLRVHNIDMGKRAKELEISFYFDSYLKTMTEVRGAKDLGAAYLQLDSELFHKIDVVRKVGVPIRLNPTVAKHDVFDQTTGIYGGYVRPEDIGLYEDCTIEFGDTDVKREETLYKLYNERKWEGALFFIVNDLRSEALNRLIVSDFGERRANCGMSCMEHGGCHLCDTVLGLASMKEKLKEYKEKV